MIFETARPDRRLFAKLEGWRSPRTSRPPSFSGCRRRRRSEGSTSCCRSTASGPSCTRSGCGRRSD